MSAAKRWFETEVEKKCTCGAGCSFEKNDHEEDCKVIPFLIESFGD